MVALAGEIPECFSFFVFALPLHTHYFFTWKKSGGRIFFLRKEKLIWVKIPFNSKKLTEHSVEIAGGVFSVISNIMLTYWVQQVKGSRWIETLKRGSRVPMVPPNRTLSVSALPISHTLNPAFSSLCNKAVKKQRLFLTILLHLTHQFPVNHFPSSRDSEKHSTERRS